MTTKNYGHPTWSNSKQIVPLAEAAAMPAQQQEGRIRDGFCAPNIDGKAVCGGYLVPTPGTGVAAAGGNLLRSGYNSPAFGAPSSCLAFGLFAQGNVPYKGAGSSAFGVFTNRNAALSYGPFL